VPHGPQRFGEYVADLWIVVHDEDPWHSPESVGSRS
jgi:hypothetical protein